MNIKHLQKLRLGLLVVLQNFGPSGGSYFRGHLLRYVSLTSFD